MSRKNYDRETALAAAKKVIQKTEGKKIWVKGPCTLGTLSALDYLSNHCNFIIEFEELQKID